jgi:hypothetical protein
VAVPVVVKLALLSALGFRTRFVDSLGVKN